MLAGSSQAELPATRETDSKSAAVEESSASLAWNWWLPWGEQPQTSVAHPPRDLDRDLQLADPLDLSELKLAIDAFDAAETPASGGRQVDTAGMTVHDPSIRLASGTEAVQPGSVGEDASSVKPPPGKPLPSNPLRGNSTPSSRLEPRTPKADSPASTTTVQAPSEDVGSTAASPTEATPAKLPAASEERELRLTPTIPEVGDAKPRQEPSAMPRQAGQAGKLPEAKAPIPPSVEAKTSARPEVRPVRIPELSPQEQESPTLEGLEADRTAKLDQEAATETPRAENPQLDPKSYVSATSQARLSDSSRLKADNSQELLRKSRVEQCLAYYLANLENNIERSPWSLMHAMLPFGVEGEIIAGNQRVNAVQWLCYNGTCRNQRLFTPTQNFFRPNVGGGVQGHEGQFLAMLAQSQVSAEYPIVVGRRQFRIADLVRYEMATCRERTELTFKLIGLSYYVDTSQVWTTDRRSRWNIEKIVKEELAQPVNGAACGGTHRLMGLTFAIRQRQAEGRPLDGQFARADKYIKDFVEYTWQLQNPDGSFSTNWFESRGNDPNMERKVQTTGHMLEWLAFTLDEAELSKPRFTKSIDFLLSKIWDERQHKWPIGPRSHAIRAVALFQQRTLGIQPGQRRQEMASQIQTQSLRR
jgi:hypothetical protein